MTRDETELHRALMRRVAQAMQIAGLNRAELARRVHLSAASVSEWWTKDAQPSSNTMQRMPRALHCNGHWLITGEGSMAPPKDSGAPLLARGVLVALAGLEDYVAQEKSRWAGAITAAIDAEDVERAAHEVAQVRPLVPRPARRSRKA
jgi:transcriptional regulator with XRE-family HTH domain